MTVRAASQADLRRKPLGSASIARPYWGLSEVRDGKLPEEFTVEILKSMTEHRSVDLLHHRLGYVNSIVIYSNHISVVGRMMDFAQSKTVAYGGPTTLVRIPERCDGSIK